MPEWLTNVSSPTSGHSWTELLTRQILALIFGLAVTLVYRWTRDADNREGKSFMATLVLLTLLITMITSVIGDNVARAFSLVGALSIVRFRTVVEDTRDTAFVILAVGVGMALGAGYTIMPILLIPMAGLAAAIFKDGSGVMRKQRYIVKLRTALAVNEGDILSAFEGIGKPTLVGVSTTRQGAAQESTYSMSFREPSMARLLMNKLTAIDGVSGVEIERD